MAAELAGRLSWICFLAAESDVYWVFGAVMTLCAVAVRNLWVARWTGAAAAGFSL
jgi:hypothetical protein